MKTILRKFLLVLLFISATSLLQGCFTDDTGPKDAWDGPQNWKNPLPSDMHSQ